MTADKKNTNIKIHIIKQKENIFYKRKNYEISGKNYKIRHQRTDDRRLRYGSYGDCDRSRMGV